ncbi:hypothetical protein EDB83DRAFT_2241626, partial [Lactarius deliciosus]
SSVSYEHIFLSSKETCALHQNQNFLSPALLEVLQVLKHVYKQGRLNFMVVSIKCATEAAINEFVTLRKTDKLPVLWHSMDEPDGSAVPRLQHVYTRVQGIL